MPIVHCQVSQIMTYKLGTKIATNLPYLNNHDQTLVTKDIGAHNKFMIFVDDYISKIITTVVLIIYHII